MCPTTVKRGIGAWGVFFSLRRGKSTTRSGNPTGLVIATPGESTDASSDAGPTPHFEERGARYPNTLWIKIGGTRDVPRLNEPDVEVLREDFEIPVGREQRDSVRLGRRSDDDVHGPSAMAASPTGQDIRQASVGTGNRSV